MKTFLVVFAVVLLVFGASILYYRNGGAPVPSVQNGTNQSNSQNKSNPVSVNLPSQSNSSVTSNLTSGNTQGAQTGASNYSSLEIRSAQTGSLKVGESRTFSAVAIDSSGAAVSVNASWSVSNPSLGTITSTSGTEVKFTAKKEGSGNLVAVYQSLKAEKAVSVAVSSTTLSASTANTAGTAPTPAAKPVTTYAVGTPAEGTEVKPYEIRITDPSGGRFNVGDSRTFTAQVLYTDNSLKTVNLTWSLNPGGLGSLNTNNGSSVTFTAQSAQSGGTLTATLGNISSSVYIQIN